MSVPTNVALWIKRRSLTGIHINYERHADRKLLHHINQIGVVEPIERLSLCTGTVTSLTTRSLLYCHILCLWEHLCVCARRI